MNYQGSYRKLLGNAKAALLAAIEIYNKPQFKYRDECFVILLMNAWELLLKALLSKHKKSIYYPKKRGEPYRTLSWQDALSTIESTKLFPRTIATLPVRRNLELISTYRNNAVHFYNTQGFSSVVYALAQTSIFNFKDLIILIFGIDLRDDISWELLPLGLKPPLDPIAYISGKNRGKDENNKAVKQFLAEVAKSIEEMKEAGVGIERFLTVYKVSLQSTKKIKSADVIVGVTGDKETNNVIPIERQVNPNITHPLRQKDIMCKIGTTLNGVKFTGHTFQAIVFAHNIRKKQHLCWEAQEGILTKYSWDLIPWLHKLSRDQIETALHEYKKYLQRRRVRNKQDK